MYRNKIVILILRSFLNSYLLTDRRDDIHTYFHIPTRIHFKTDPHADILISTHTQQLYNLIIISLLLRVQFSHYHTYTW